MVKDLKKTKSKKSKEADEFSQYIHQQQINTTFNGAKLKEFSWYKKLFGLSSK